MMKRAVIAVLILPVLVVYALAEDLATSTTPSASFMAAMRSQPVVTARAEASINSKALNDAVAAVPEIKALDEQIAQLVANMMALRKQRTELVKQAEAKMPDLTQKRNEAVQKYRDVMMAARKRIAQAKVSEE